MEIEKAVCVISNDENNVLLIRQPDPSLIWEFPGGPILKGESVTEAGTRVVRDNLDVEVEITKGISDIEFKQNGIVYRSFLIAAFLKRDQIRKLEINRDEIAVFNVKSLRRMENVMPEVSALIKKIIDGEVKLSV
jgi:ADP-ribose pyrophosphatase YjhB (NUDIX family)